MHGIDSKRVFVENDKIRELTRFDAAFDSLFKTLPSGIDGDALERFQNRDALLGLAEIPPPITEAVDSRTASISTTRWAPPASPSRVQRSSLAAVIFTFRGRW